MDENKRLWTKIPANKTPSSVKIDNDFWKYFKLGDKLLDAGCGSGRGINEAVKKGLCVVGFDINRNEIAQLKKKKISNVQVKYGDVLKIKFKNKFDGALMLGILSGLKKSERKRALRRVKSFIKKGGHILISEFEFSKKFKKRYENDFKVTGEYGTLSAVHNGKEVFRSHNYTKKELFDLIKNAGLKVIKFKRAQFVSYHKQKKPGMMIIAKN